MHPLRTPSSDLRTMEYRFGRDDVPYSGPISMPTSPAAVTGGGDPVPSPVSYERDFAPLSQKFFGMAFNSGMAPRRAAESFFSADTALKQAYMGNTQLRAADEQSRLRRVQYESSVFALESARDKARKEREMMEGLAPIQAELNNILGDTKTPAADRRRALGLFGVRYAGVLSTNPVAANAYASAQRGVVEDDRTRFTAKDFLTASRGKGAEFVKAQEARLGRPLLPDDELPFSESAAELDRLNKLYTDDKTKLEMDEKARATREKNLNTVLGRVARIELEDSPVVTDKSGKVVAQPKRLKDDTDLMYVDSVIEGLGTSEEIKLAKGMTADRKVALAKRIGAEALLGKRDKGKSSYISSLAE